jgi:hypothetical protein
MKIEVLEELAKKWERKGKEPEMMDGSKEAEIGNAKIITRCKTYRACADNLRELIALLED